MDAILTAGISRLCLAFIGAYCIPRSFHGGSLEVTLDRWFNFELVNAGYDGCRERNHDLLVIRLF